MRRKESSWDEWDKPKGQALTRKSFTRGPIDRLGGNCQRESEVVCIREVCAGVWARGVVAAEGGGLGELRGKSIGRRECEWPAPDGEGPCGVVGRWTHGRCPLFASSEAKKRARTLCDKNTTDIGSRLTSRYSSVPRRGYHGLLRLLQNHTRHPRHVGEILHRQPISSLPPTLLHRTPSCESTHASSIVLSAVLSRIKLQP